MTQTQEPNQRWHKWINVDSKTCPPWGAIAITGSRMVGTELVFEGQRLPVDNISDPLPPWYNGTPWNVGFTTEAAIPPGEQGDVTFDQPSWVMVEDSVLVGDFVSSSARGQLQEWSLGRMPSNVISLGLGDYWTGFRVLAVKYFVGWLEIWSEQQSGVVAGQYAIALIGALNSGRLDPTTSTTTWSGGPPCGEEISIWDANVEQWFSLTSNCIMGCKGPAAEGGSSLSPGDYHWEARVFPCS